MQYIYDGSFDGFLTVCYEHVYREKATEIFVDSPDLQLSFGGQFKIETDILKSEKVANALERKVSHAALRRAYRAFLTEEPGKDMDVLSYIFYAFKKGRQVDSLHGDPIVRRIDLLNHKVSWELDRFLGILRFGIVEGPKGRELMYAAFAPENDILQSLMPHFLNRFRREPFIIHDFKREKAAFAHNGTWAMRYLPRDYAPEYTKDEKQYRALWKNYFNTAAIAQRVNPDLQRSFVPTRYWQYTVEYSDLDLTRPGEGRSR